MNYSRLTVLVLIAAAAGFGLRWATASAATKDSRGTLVHVVLFDLKEDVSASEADTLIADGYKLLARVPSVKQMHTGRPAVGSKASKTKDYDVGLYCEFRDEAGLAQYIEHPLHQQYVQKHRDHWAGVRVFDFTAR